MTRHSYSDTAVTTELTALLNSSGLVAQVGSTSGYPDATDGPFVVTLERDTIREEKILCSTIVGLSVTIVQRGYGGTTPQDHSIGSSFEHTWSGAEADEVNKHANATTQQHGLGPSDGSFVGTTKTQTITNKTLSGNDNVFTDIPATASQEIVDLITAEAAARDAADDAEVLARDAAIAAEAAIRLSADDALTLAIAAAVAAAVPLGTVSMYAGSIAPGGYLLCQGQAVSRSTYSALFALLGVTYGVGDGSTTFNIPDLRTRAPRGVGTGYTLGQSGGADTVALAVTNLPGHQHDMVHNHSHDFAIASGGSHTHGTDAANVVSDLSGTPQFEAGIGAQDRSFVAATVSSAGSHTHSLTGQIEGPSQSDTDFGIGLNATPIDVRTPYVAVNFIIKAT